MKDKLSVIPLFFLILFAIVQFLAIRFLYSNYKETQELNQKIYLEQNLDKSIKILEREFDKTSILVSGLKSHIMGSGKELSSDQIRNYIIDQLNFFDYSENIIINYIDADHKFVYSTGTKIKEVNDLAGTSVLDIRQPEIISKLNALLKTDDILAFPPLNLYEGHVGIPIDFRYKRNGEVKGYFAVIVDIKNFINAILEADIKDEFVYRYSSGDDLNEFDRERVYDNTKTYSTKKDAANLHRNKKEYLSKNISFLGLPIEIGIDYKQTEIISDIGNFVNSILGILVLLLIGSSLLLYFYFQNIQKTKSQNIINTELSKSNKLLKKFIYASSHDLKQPLVNISNFHSLLSKKHFEHIDTSSKKYLTVIKQNIDYLNTVLDDLLIYSRVIREDKKKENLNIPEILDQIYTAYNKEHIKIIYKGSKHCFGVKSEITRLLQNLISNSIKYNTSNIIEINIENQEKENYNQFTIKDNGIGIKEEYKSIVFEEFQRVNHKDYEGTGLGLSICKEIVVQHGGSINISSNIDKGTEIIFNIAKYGK